MFCFLRLSLFAALSLLIVWSSVEIALAVPTVHVAAAADLATCIGTLDAGFAKNVGDANVKTSIGASGSLYAQLKNGAPFDVFLSADQSYPRELARAGLADEATLTLYALGQLIMWGNDPQWDLHAGFHVLKDPRIQHIAIANPDTAPYGRAAKAALQKVGIWEAVKHKLVFGENIVQTAQFVETGNAQIGFVGIAHSQAAKGVNQVWRVPADLYPPIRQAGIVTLQGKKNSLALKYLDFLRSEVGRRILQQCGFALPEKNQ